MTNNSNRSKKAVIYLRVSSTSQVRKAHDPEGYSIPAQREACLRHAASLGAHVVREYVEPGRTGTNMNRPALQQMLTDLDTLHPELAIFYDLSRAARDELDSLWLLREFERHGTKIESTLERIDDSDSGKLLFTIMAGVNAFRSRGDGTKVRVGLDRKHQAGGSHGPAKLGYLNVAEEINGSTVQSIAVDPVRAPLVQLAFELMATGDETLSTVLATVTEAGLRSRPTPRKPSKVISRSTLHRLLTNPYYTGVVTRNGVTLPGRHEALVTQETFDAVQAVLESNRQGGVRSQYHPHYLAGTAFCGKCGRRLGYGRHKGKLGGTYEYLSCLSRCTAAGPCEARYVPIELAECATEQLHSYPWLTSTEQDSLRSHVRELAEARSETARRESARHARRLDELTTQQTKLVQLFYSDAVSEDVLRAEQVRIEAERAETERWLAEATRNVEAILSRLEQALALLASPGATYAQAASSVRRLINQAIFERIEIWFKPDSERDDVAIDAAHDRRYEWEASSFEDQRLGGAFVLNPVFERVVAAARSLRPQETNNPRQLLASGGSHFIYMAGRAGLEPATTRLTVESSAIELPPIGVPSADGVLIVSANAISR